MKKLLLTSFVYTLLLILLTIASCSNDASKVTKKKEPTDRDYYQVIEIKFTDTTIDTITLQHGYDLSIKIKRRIPLLYCFNTSDTYATHIRSFSVIERKLKP